MNEQCWRLEEAGDGQVPLVAATAFDILMKGGER